jgi:hypothetical protein
VGPAAHFQSPIENLGQSRGCAGSALKLAINVSGFPGGGHLELAIIRSIEGLVRLADAGDTLVDGGSGRNSGDTILNSPSHLSPHNWSSGVILFASASATRSVDRTASYFVAASSNVFLIGRIPQDEEEVKRQREKGNSRARLHFVGRPLPIRQDISAFQGLF